MEPEVLQALMSTPMEGEAEFVKTLKSDLTEEQKNAAIAQYRIQKGMRDLLSDDVMSSVVNAAGYKVAKAVGDNEGVNPTEPNVTSGKVDPKAKQKDKLGKKKEEMSKSINLSSLPEDQRLAVESVLKSNASLEEKSSEMSTVLKSMMTEIENLKREKVEKSFIDKATTSYDNIPMGNRELGLMLKSAHDVSPEFAKGFETLLGTMNSMAEQSALFTTMGAVNKSGDGGAMAKIDALADGIVQKSVVAGNPVDRHKAVATIMQTPEGAQLYNEYLKEKSPQNGGAY